MPKIYNNKDMNNNEKNHISQAVATLSNQLSQNKVAKRVGVSSATISQIINGNWKLIKPEMWRKIKVKLKLDLNWVTASTTLFNHLNGYLTAAQNRQLTVAFSHKAGAGKTHLFNAYSSFAPNKTNTLRGKKQKKCSIQTFLIAWFYCILVV